VGGSGHQGQFVSTLPNSEKKTNAADDHFSGQYLQLPSILTNSKGKGKKCTPPPGAFDLIDCYFLKKYIADPLGVVKTIFFYFQVSCR
jgi:hypothetical protein